MEIQDDRTPEQKRTHYVVWLATDRFMSGWGRASGGASYAAWACKPQHANSVERWLRNRSEMKRVRHVASDYRPKASHCAHLHIYIVDDDHPATRA